MLQDNGTWLSTLKKDNVELVVDGIECITASGITCKNGDQYDVDIIVFATGFHANRYLWPMDIVGKQGAILSEVWGDDPSAYSRAFEPKTTAAKDNAARLVEFIKMISRSPK